MPYTTPDQLDATLRSGKISGVYLFDGPENWLKERAVEQIIAKVVPAEARDFNFEKFDGRSNTGGDVVSSMHSLPFLSPQRLVIVQAADEFGSADSRLIAAGLEGLPKTTCLVFLYEGKANLREEIPATVNSMGTLVTFWTPFPNQLPRWVTAEAKRRGRTISYDAAERLAESCTDLQEISNELDKLLLFVGKKTTITLDDVLEHGLPDAEGDQKELEAAIYRKDLTEALRQGMLLSEMGVRPEMIFPTFERIFRQLVLAHFYRAVRGWNLTDIQGALRLRGRTQQALLDEGLRSYSPEEAARAFEKIVQAEFDVKSGTLPGPVAITLLLSSVCGSPARRPLAVR